MTEFRERIDAILGLVPMYKLVVVGLLAIIAMSFLLMTTGYLPYSPIEFATSIILLVGVSYGSNKLFGYLFGILPHTESAIITGLILALLFSPPTTILVGIKLALIASIAMATKYVLAIRGKHIFNPAAIAIVIGSVSGLAYATWWIATPALLLVTLIVALAIVYKTQKIVVSLVFLAVAVTMIIGQSVLQGTVSLQGISAALTSWPLVFFAGVMLTEPLTLPPHRRQQMVVATLVAVLMTLPIHYAGIAMTPALALVAGNVPAFYFGIRRGIKLRFVGKKKVGADGYEFTFDAPKFQYQPGQYIELSLPHSSADFRGTRRVFTMIGQPHEDQISIATRFPEKRSTYKDALLALKIGQVITSPRIAGDFTLPVDKSVPILCIASGIGITPFVTFAMNAGKRDITILYSVKLVSDLAFVHELEQYNVNVIVVSSDETKLPTNEWKQERGRLTTEIIKRYLPPQGSVYISGPPTMVTTTKQLVGQLGVTDIHTDHFSGY